VSPGLMLFYSQPSKFVSVHQHKVKRCLTCAGRILFFPATDSRPWIVAKWLLRRFAHLPYCYGNLHSKFSWVDRASSLSQQTQHKQTFEERHSHLRHAAQRWLL